MALNRFTLRVADDLGQQLVQVSFGVGQNTEMLELTWEEFFTELVRCHGDEPVVSYKTLDERFKALSGPISPPPSSP